MKATTEIAKIMKYSRNMVCKDISLSTTDKNYRKQNKNRKPIQRKTTTFSSSREINNEIREKFNVHVSDMLVGKRLHKINLF